MLTVSTASLVSKKAENVSLLQRILWLLNTLYNQILAILTVLLFWIIFEHFTQSGLRFWHLLLSTAAYIPLMASAIILFSDDNLPSLYIPRTRRYVIHGILLLISFASVSAGNIIETYNKTKTNSPHFKTDHAILGLVSWILLFLAVVVGIAAAKAKTFTTFIKPVVAKLIHNLLGIAGFVIGMGSLYLKLTIVQRYSSENVYTASKWIFWIITVWSLLSAFKSLWGQIKTIFSK